MKLFVLTKLEALAIASVPLALGLVIGAGIVYLATRNRRASLWENRKRRPIFEPRAL